MVPSSSKIDASISGQVKTKEKVEMCQLSMFSFINIHLDIRSVAKAFSVLCLAAHMCARFQRPPALPQPPLRLQNRRLKTLSGTTG